MCNNHWLYVLFNSAVLEIYFIMGYIMYVMLFFVLIWLCCQFEYCFVCYVHTVVKWWVTDTPPSLLCSNLCLPGSDITLISDTLLLYTEIPFSAQSTSESEHWNRKEINVCVFINGFKSYIIIFSVHFQIYRGILFVVCFSVYSFNTDTFIDCK